jgi:hypothetical protein
MFLSDGMGCKAIRDGPEGHVRGSMSLHGLGNTAINGLMDDA